MITSASAKCTQRHTRRPSAIESVHGSALDARLDKLRATVAEVETVVSSGDVVLSNGRSVSHDLIDRWRAVAELCPTRLARRDADRTGNFA